MDVKSEIKSTARTSRLDGIVAHKESVEIEK